MSKKKNYVTRRQMAQHLFDLVLYINSMECRTRNIGKPTACISFSGHVSLITIDIYMNGWEQGESPDRTYFLYMCKDGFSIDEYNRVCKELEEIRDGICTG